MSGRGRFLFFFIEFVRFKILLRFLRARRGEIAHRLRDAVSCAIGVGLGRLLRAGFRLSYTPQIDDIGHNLSRPLFCLCAGESGALGDVLHIEIDNFGFRHHG